MQTGAQTLAPPENVSNTSGLFSYWNISCQRFNYKLFSWRHRLNWTEQSPTAIRQCEWAVAYVTVIRMHAGKSSRAMKQDKVCNKSNKWGAINAPTWSRGEERGQLWRQTAPRIVSVRSVAGTIYIYIYIFLSDTHTHTHTQNNLSPNKIKSDDLGPFLTYNH